MYINESIGIFNAVDIWISTLVTSFTNDDWGNKVNFAVVSCTAA